MNIDAVYGKGIKNRYQAAELRALNKTKVVKWNLRTALKLLQLKREDKIINILMTISE
jgi:hypothetical protein